MDIDPGVNSVSSSTLDTMIEEHLHEMFGHLSAMGYRPSDVFCMGWPQLGELFGFWIRDNGVES